MRLNAPATWLRGICFRSGRKSTRCKDVILDHNADEWSLSPRIGYGHINNRVPIVPWRKPSSAAILVGYARDYEVRAFRRHGSHDCTDCYRGRCRRCPRRRRTPVARIVWSRRGRSPAMRSWRRTWRMWTRARRGDDGFRPTDAVAGGDPTDAGLDRGADAFRMDDIAAGSAPDH